VEIIILNLVQLSITIIFILMVHQLFVHSAFGIKSYCSNLARTLVVNPSEEVKNMYKFLLECEELIMHELKHDVQLCDVYKMVREKN